VPPGELTCLGVVVGVALPAVARVVDLAIVELDERALKTGNYQMFVVARVADGRRAVARPRHVLEAV
jgi:hypothetical protein